MLVGLRESPGAQFEQFMGSCRSRTNQACSGMGMALNSSFEETEAECV